MSLEPRIVKESFTRLEPAAEEATAYFYGRLFADHPRLRALFPPAMDGQRDRLFHALSTIVWSLDSPEALIDYLERLGRDHRKFGVLPEHYPAVGAALVATMRRFAGDGWTPEAEAAWTAAYRTAADTMIGAAEEDAARTPPWWVAEVVEHDRRRADLAVLTLRPGRPLPFTAGQYLSVQVSRWPRVWRRYSIANAPRSDGRVRLHVRAVPGGWVSGALVRHTGTGDTVLLGPALGGMSLDAAGDRDLVLVAGGTGLAPLKALIEEAVNSGRDRDVLLVAGARDEDSLYDMDDLRLLQSSCPWLRVVTVASADRTVCDALDELDDLPDLEGREAYVAGPIEMIRAAVGTLERLGVPPDRIHHDLLEADSRTGVPVCAGG